jgi:hypothetical protein
VVGVASEKKADVALKGPSFTSRVEDQVNHSKKNRLANAREKGMVW